MSGSESSTCPSGCPAGAAIRDIRSFGLPDRLPSNSAFQSRDGVEATYEEAWLAIRVIARTTGRIEWSPSTKTSYADPVLWRRRFDRNLGTSVDAADSRRGVAYLRQIAQRRRLARPARWVGPSSSRTTSRPEGVASRTSSRALVEDLPARRGRRLHRADVRVGGGRRRAPLPGRARPCRHAPADATGGERGRSARPDGTTATTWCSGPRLRWGCSPAGSGGRRGWGM